MIALLTFGNIVVTVFGIDRTLGMYVRCICCRVTLVIAIDQPLKLQTKNLVFVTSPA